MKRREEWQHSLKQRLKQNASDRLAQQGEDYIPEPPPPLPDFGFSYPEDYVERTVALLKLSNYQCWPEGNGWANEDDLLVSDVLTWLALERRMEYEAEHGLSDDADIVPVNTPRIRMEQIG